MCMTKPPSLPTVRIPGGSLISTLNPIQSLLADNDTYTKGLKHPYRRGRELSGRDE